MIKWLDRAEARFGFLAIPGLLRIVCAFVALVFVLVKMNPYFIELIDLDPARVRAGEVWRLFTYIFIPQFGGLFPDWLGVAMYVLFLWWMGDGLENALGPFKLTIFYVVGMIGTTIAAFFFGSNFSNAMLHSSLFLAFARFYPETMIYLFWVLPVKVKWLAWITAAFLFIGFVSNSWDYRAGLIAAFANFLLFFGPDLIADARQRTSVAQRRRKFDTDVREGAGESLHQCVTCGRTEVVAPELEFRVSKDGNEYCLEHLPKAVVS